MILGSLQAHSFIQFESLHLIYIYQHFHSPHRPLWYLNYSFRNFRLYLLSTNQLIICILSTPPFFDLKGTKTLSPVLHFRPMGSTLPLAQMTIQFGFGALRPAKLLLSRLKGIQIGSSLSSFRPMESTLLPGQEIRQFDCGT